jgi:peptide-methionine (S)-S-oxide reductase
MSFAAPIASTFFSRIFRPFSTSSPILSVTPESQARNMSTTTEKATLAAGCFWGVEHLFRKHFGNGKGLLDAKVGYSGGQTSSPSYRAVCSGDTGRKCLLRSSPVLEGVEAVTCVRIRNSPFSFSLQTPKLSRFPLIPPS